ncbi:hypothetical protein C6P44_000140 [Monosporozyma unispora]|nr:hypothetical protein C6P44_000140 [Kazachstania unispora]
MLGLIILLLGSLLRVSLSVANDDVFNEEITVAKATNNEGRNIISLNGFQNTFGPTIIVTPGSYFKLTVHNNLCSLKEYKNTQDVLYKEYCEVSIHFHGVVPLPNKVDGIPNITQDPIKPEDSYTYEFEIPKDACGTFWYHSHSSVQYGDGLRGIFIVKCEEIDNLVQEVVGTLENKEMISLSEGHLSNSGDKTTVEPNGIQEEIITLSDYYNDWNFDVFSRRVMSSQGGPDPRVDDSLLNGNKFDNDIQELNSRTKYLKLHIINAGMSGTQILNIKDHKFVVIETDGIMIEPYVQETLSLAVGQRYTIIVKIEDNEEYIHIINGCGKMMGYVKKSMWFMKKGKQLDTVPMNSNIEIKHLPGLNKHERYHDYLPHTRQNLQYYEDYIESITLDYEYSRDIMPEYGTRLYLINGLPFQEYVKQPYKFTYKEDVNECLQIIINSIDHMRHPWHLHGFHFQVISMGEGGEGPLYLEETGSPAYQKYLDDVEYWGNQEGEVPMTRDSINIPGNSYAVIRFIPNRPGKWLFHCHVEWHMGKGLGYIIDVATTKSTTTSTTTSPTPLNHSETLSNKVTTNKCKVIMIYLLIMIAINGFIYFTL